MDSDGNCMFRTWALFACSKNYQIFAEIDSDCYRNRIADQLTGNPSDHMQYRDTILEYIERNEDHFKLFIEDDEPFEDYLERMK